MFPFGESRATETKQQINETLRALHKFVTFWVGSFAINWFLIFFRFSDEDLNVNKNIISTKTHVSWVYSAFTHGSKFVKQFGNSLMCRYIDKQPK